MVKKMFAALVVLACALLVSVHSGQKTGKFISCPVDEVRTEVTTSLPDGWFQTPQVGRLERTRRAMIGGRSTLICEYWAYGRTVGVMREDPAKCVPERGGFRCP